MNEYIIPEKIQYALPENCDFEKIIQGDFGQKGKIGRGGFDLDGWGKHISSSCTPRITGVGLVINAPRELVYPNNNANSKGNVLPVTGRIKHEISHRMDVGDISESVVFVMIDSKTLDIGFGRIPPVQNAIPYNLPKRKEPPKKGVIIGFAFTVNLLRICDMPLYETEYIVYAMVGPYKSNVMTINVTERK